MGSAAVPGGSGAIRENEAEDPDVDPLHVVPPRPTMDSVARIEGVNRLFFVLIPLVFVIFLAMRHWGYIAAEPLWLYALIFGIAGVLYVVIELHAVDDPSPVRLNVQIAVAAATTTAIMYVTGWGPAMIAGYATAAVLTVVRNGSRTWRLCVFWSLVGIAMGQTAISLHWAPSMLPIGDSDAIAILAGIAFVAMMRIAALESEQKERAEGLVRANEERFRSLIAHSSDVILLLDGSATEIRFASPASLALLKLDPTALVGRRPESIVHPDDLDRVKHDIAESIETCGLVLSEFRVVSSEGTAHDVDCVITDLRSNPAVSGFVINLHDVTERKQLQSNLEYRVQHDALTELPNRQFMFDRLQESLARSRRHGGAGPALMFLDLDRFKEVNDRLGHAAGDELLIQFSDRLASIVRESDVVARFGGDEFVILCEGVRGEDAMIQFAHRTLEVVREPFLVGGQPCSVGLSVGIALLGQTSTASEALLHADLAMYEAKRRGDSPHIHFLNCQADQAVST
jgi:diguanylate cyclase (GGDEF)-like protein/PAS domain S-box-containing protein